MKGADARRRVRELDRLNAFISLTDDDGDGPLVGVKDLIDVRGTPTTGGGVILPIEPAAADATLVRRIRDAGCVIVGKTNLYEWAYGVSSVNPHYGDVRNPRDPSRSAGGSSSGSAVAVAAGLCDWAVGTDTAGSIRIPASLTGVVGFKPTYGIIPTDGVIPLSRSLDTVGSLALTVGDAVRAVEIMSASHSLSLAKIPATKELRLAVPRGWVTELDNETARVWEEVATELPEITFPDRAHMFDVAATIQSAEAAAYHEPWLHRYSDRYSPDVLERLYAGLDVSAVDYLRAMEDRRRLRDSAELGMGDLDALVLPTSAIVAPLLGSTEVREPLIRFTRPFNLTGQPVITIPAHTKGLPVGIQVVGRLGDDQGLAAVALALEGRWNRDLFST